MVFKAIVRHHWRGAEFVTREQAWAIPLCVSTTFLFTIVFWWAWYRGMHSRDNNRSPAAGTDQDANAICKGSLASNVFWYGIHAANVIHFLPVMTIEFDAVFGEFQPDSADGPFWDPAIGDWMRYTLTRDQRLYVVIATIATGVVSAARPWNSGLATFTHCFLLYCILCCNASFLNTLGMLSTFAFLPIMAFGTPDSVIALTEWYSLFSTMVSGLAKWYAGWPFPSSLGCFLPCRALVKSWIYPYFSWLVPAQSAMDVFMGVTVLLVEVVLPFVLVLTSPWKPIAIASRGIKFWVFLGSCAVLIGTFVIIIATLQVPGTFFLTYMTPIIARLIHVMSSPVAGVVKQKLS